jgi:hypothetical protein
MEQKNTFTGLNFDLPEIETPPNIITDGLNISIVTNNGNELLTTVMTKALEYMNNSKLVLDSSRLIYEAAILFDDVEVFERAAFCYLKSTNTTTTTTTTSTSNITTTITTTTTNTTTTFTTATTANSTTITY